MQPDDAPMRSRPADEVRVGALLDADLVRIDGDLRAAGRQAELSLRGRTQPTRWFAMGLRARLLGRLREPTRAGETPATPR
jgi:hypothetical protein